jgi:hypothetical protein
MKSQNKSPLFTISEVIELDQDGKPIMRPQDSCHTKFVACNCTGPDQGCSCYSEYHGPDDEEPKKSPAPAFII